jgi:hypothetical protein
LSCGFQSVVRTSVQQPDGGWTDDAVAGPPNYPQSSIVAYLVQQPPQAVGSSFATPLLSGVVALMDEPETLGGFMRASYLTGRGQKAIAAEVYREATNEEGEEAVRLLLEAADAVPHRHDLETGPLSPCFECSVFAERLYADLGRHLLGFQKIEAAERWLRIGLAVCPWSTDAAANLGASLMHRAAGNRELLQEARSLYERALASRPDSQTFLMTIRSIDEQLA